jgi:3-oxoacyl-[acyl-carrier-protein] synthase II
MGAAGALELFISAKSIKDCKIPPTFHTEKQKELRGIQIIKEAETGPCSLVLSNSFAFGGNNVSIGISAPEYFNKSQLDGELSDDDVVITGIGCIGNKHTSFNEYVSLLDNNDTEFAENESYKGKYSSIYSGVIPEYDYRNYMSPDFFRKTDFISKLSIISSASAIKDANLKITRANTERIGLVYGTGTGPISTIEQLNLDIIQKGLVGMNAFLFPNSVNNAAPGYITMNSRIKGTTITLNSGAATFNLSILYARLILLQNKADNVIVTVSDDYNEVYHAAYDKLGLLNKKSKVDSFFESQNTRLLSPGSVSIILERKETAIEREAKIYARVLGGTFSGFCSVSSASSANDELDFVGQEMYNTYDATLKSVGLSEKDLDIYFSSSTGKISMDIIERDNIINKCKIPIISSARQFCGYNISLIPAYSTLSAIAAFSGHPAYNIVSGQTHKQNNIKKAMIASYAIGETFGNIIIDKFN